MFSLNVFFKDITKPVEAHGFDLHIGPTFIQLRQSDTEFSVIPLDAVRYFDVKETTDEY